MNDWIVYRLHANNEDTEKENAAEHETLPQVNMTVCLNKYT